MNTFKPSPQQQMYFNWITQGKGSCILSAVAGSGKTTTLIEGLKLMKGDIFFGAYNKKIADEIQSKSAGLGLDFGSRLNVSTMHSAGFSIWRRSGGRNVKVDDRKCSNIFMEIADKQDNDLMSAVLQLVSLAKQSAFGAVNTPTEGDWLDLIDHFNIDTLDQEDKTIDLARKVLSESIRQDPQVIDFDDMIYAPLVHKVKAKEYDWVLIDEAQDTNAARRALALLMLKRGGRLVAVGDPHQAIYGFTGADAEALDLIAEAVSAEQIPLTTSYRCPKLVTELARTWVSHIESHASAPDGRVTRFATHDEMFAEIRTGDAILCRFNAPIIGLAYRFIANGVPAKIEGRDIGNGLKTLARRWRVKRADVLRERLMEHQERETSKLRMRQKESQAVAVEDRVRCLNVLIDRCLSLDPECADIVAAVCGEIDKLFGDNVGSNVIRLMSVHKSKGLEFPRVFWLQTGEPKWIRKDWEKCQELNLNYVACTRAQSELYLVPMSPKEG